MWLLLRKIFRPPVIYSIALGKKHPRGGIYRKAIIRKLFHYCRSSNNNHLPRGPPILNCPPHFTKSSEMYFHIEWFAVWWYHILHEKKGASVQAMKKEQSRRSLLVLLSYCRGPFLAHPSSFARLLSISQLPSPPPCSNPCESISMKQWSNSRWEKQSSQSEDHECLGAI